MLEEDYIFETQDGSHSLFSQQYGVSYHSKYGAIQESRHVFIEAGLYPLLLSHSTVKILEIGFGTGLNAFLTLLEAEKRAMPIQYDAVEAYPITMQQATELNYVDLLQAKQWERAFHQLHESAWNTPVSITPNFQFQKIQSAFEAHSYPSDYDLIYFDAFAPTAQPELWEADLLGKMYQALKPNGILVTYCAKGVVKRTLKALGFEVESLPGPPGKREMTRCSKSPLEKGR